MKKIVVMIVVLIMLLSLVLTGCGKDTGVLDAVRAGKNAIRGQTRPETDGANSASADGGFSGDSLTELTEETLRNTYWIADAHKESEETAPFPVDAEGNGMALVFGEDTASLIDCDGIVFEDREFGCRDGKVLFEGTNMEQVYAFMNGDRLELRSAIGASWLFVPVDKDTANAYIEELLDGKADFVIGETNDHSAGITQSDEEYSYAEEAVNTLTSDLTDHLGIWQFTDEPYSTLELYEEGGKFALRASFYRLVGFEAALVEADAATGCYMFRSEDGFKCEMYLFTDKISLYVEPEDVFFADFFRNRAFVYEPQKELGLDDWLGTWVSSDGNGEALTVTSVSEEGIVLIFHKLTASGESYTDTEYTLFFENGGTTWAAEDRSVIDRSGWRYAFDLYDGYIMVYSRYPDQEFIRQ